MDARVRFDLYLSCLSAFYALLMVLREIVTSGEVKKTPPGRTLVPTKKESQRKSSHLQSSEQPIAGTKHEVKEEN